MKKGVHARLLRLQYNDFERRKVTREDGKIIDVYFLYPFGAGAMCTDITGNKYIVESHAGETIQVCSKLEYLKRQMILNLDRPYTIKEIEEYLLPLGLKIVEV